MENSFIIQGGNKIEGEIDVQGSKNAATKLIAATLLSSDEFCLIGLPEIEDVGVMLEILEEMGAKIRQKGNMTFIKNENIDPSKISHQKIKKVRSSVVFMGPMLARFGEIEMPYPGGDKIGARALDTHFNMFEDLGCRVVRGDEIFKITKTSKVPKINKVVLDEFSVTATENLLMIGSLMPTEIKASIVAEEPHVQNLILFLNKMGADISLLPSHKIRIRGANVLRGVEWEVPSDYIEAGTFLVAALLAGGPVRINKFPVEDLELFLKKLERAGANIKIENKNTVLANKSDNLNISKMQTMIYPGIPTDLQSPIGVLATQSPGKTIIHDPLYEGRLNYIKELQKMNARVNIIDAHRAEIYGPTQLKGATIRGKDIRGGMSLIIAGLIAEGETKLENAYEVDRGYEKIDSRLRALGANIKRI